MFVKSNDDRKIWVRTGEPNLEVECSGSLGIDEFLNLKFPHEKETCDKTRHQLEESIQNYEQQISDLLDIQDACKVALAIQKYKENKVLIKIEENQFFSF